MEYVISGLGTQDSNPRACKKKIYIYISWYSSFFFRRHETKSPLTELSLSAHNLHTTHLNKEPSLGQQQAMPYVYDAALFVHASYAALFVHASYAALFVHASYAALFGHAGYLRRFS